MGETLGRVFIRATWRSMRVWPHRMPGIQRHRQPRLQPLCIRRYQFNRYFPQELRPDILFIQPWTDTLYRTRRYSVHQRQCHTYRDGRPGLPSASWCRPTPVAQGRSRHTPHHIRAYSNMLSYTILFGSGA